MNIKILSLAGAALLISGAAQAFTVNRPLMKSPGGEIFTATGTTKTALFNTKDIVKISHTPAAAPITDERYFKQFLTTAEVLRAIEGGEAYTSIKVKNKKSPGYTTLRVYERTATTRTIRGQFS